MASNVLVPVSAKSWTSPNVTGALGVEEESVNPEIQSSALVMSGEEERIDCVAVCASTVLGCVSGDNV